jgi:DNA-binding protein H-NS
MESYQELLAQKEELDRQIEEVRQADRAEAIVQSRQLIAFFGLNAVELGFAPAPAAKRSKGVRKVPTAKYFGPNGETWSGHGRAPKWLTGDRDLYLTKVVPLTDTSDSVEE